MMNDKNRLYLCFVFLLLLSSLAYSQYNCSDSEKKCVEWKVGERTTERIETPEYQTCLEKLEYEKKMQQCLKELDVCFDAFSVCVSNKYGGQCTYTNGAPNCVDCLTEFEAEQACVKKNRETYSYLANESACYGGAPTARIGQHGDPMGTTTDACDYLLVYNTTDNPTKKECVRYECPRAVFENVCINSGYILVPNSEAYQYNSQMPAPCSGANHCFDEYGNLQPPTFTMNETCVDPKSKNSKTSPCGDKASEACERTNITKYVNVTYIFDRGYNTTVSEPYTFEKQECYKVIQHLGGENCDEIINTSRSGSSIVSPEPVPVGMKTVQCSRCPSVCERKLPSGITCGACVCPENNGFCDSVGERGITNGKPVYCLDELLLAQKSDNQTCQNNFECLSNFCSKGECYDIRSNVDNQANIIDRILNWIKRLFGLSV